MMSSFLRHRLILQAAPSDFTTITSKKERSGIVLPERCWIPFLVVGARVGVDTTAETVTTFDLLSYNLKLPIAYSRANYLIELSTQFSLLSNKTQIQPGKLNTFFTASFYYQFKGAK